MNKRLKIQARAAFIASQGKPAAGQKADKVSGADVATMRRRELYKLAKKAGIPAYSRMKTEALRKALA